MADNSDYLDPDNFCNTQDADDNPILMELIYMRADLRMTLQSLQDLSEDEWTVQETIWIEEARNSITTAIFAVEKIIGSLTTEK